MTTKDYQRKSPIVIFLTYFKNHWKLFLLDILCAMCIAGIDLSFPLVTRSALYDMLPGQMYKTFFTVMVIVLCCYVLRSVLNFIVAYFGHTFGIRVEADIRKDLFAHMQTLSFDFYDQNRTGQLMSRLTTDLFELTELAHHGPEDLLTSILTIIGALIVMGMICWPLALVVAVTVPIFLLTVILGCIACAALGVTTHWLFFLGIFILAKVGFHSSIVFYDSMLPEITTPERMDNVSSMGYAFGYIGSVIPFVACLVLVLFCDSFGLTMGGAMVAAFLITAAWWAVLTVPLAKRYKQTAFVEKEGTALGDTVAGEGKQGEDLGIGAAEGELTESEEIGLLQSPLGGEAAGMGQGVLDAVPHIRHRHLGDDAMVNIFHHGVDHALAVDDDLHLVGRHTEEMHRLDDLEALVHEGGGVYRDLGSHFPGGVSQGHGFGDGLQLFLGVAVEGAARGGQQDAADLIVVSRA